MTKAENLKWVLLYVSAAIGLAWCSVKVWGV